MAFHSLLDYFGTGGERPSRLFRKKLFSSGRGAEPLFTPGQHGSFYYRLPSSPMGGHLAEDA